MGELRMSETTELVDTYGRVHRDLRVSLTDRCSLRCTYCMPADFSDWIANEKLLSTEELVTVIGLCVDAGITQVRLTGGEPLLRRDIADIIRRINELPKAPRISLTTNALRLAEVAQDLKNAGLQRVNEPLLNQ